MFTLMKVFIGFGLVAEPGALNSVGCFAVTFVPPPPAISTSPTACPHASTSHSGHHQAPVTTPQDDSNTRTESGVVRDISISLLCALSVLATSCHSFTGSLRLATTPHRHMAVQSSHNLKHQHRQAHSHAQ